MLILPVVLHWGELFISMHGDSEVHLHTIYFGTYYSNMTDGKPGKKFKLNDFKVSIVYDYIKVTFHVGSIK